MAGTTPYTLAASDLSGSPDDVIAAVHLLQAHGFLVTREPVTRIRAAVELTADEMEHGDPESIKRHVRRQLVENLGTEILSAAQGAVALDAERKVTQFRAFADIIRPSRGLNPLANILSAE